MLIDRFTDILENIWISIFNYSNYVDTLTIPSPNDGICTPIFYVSEASPFFRDSIMIEHHISLNATEKKIGHIFSHCIISVSVYYRSWWWWWWQWHIIYSYQLFQIYLFNTSIHYIYIYIIHIYIYIYMYIYLMVWMNGILELYDDVFLWLSCHSVV